MKIMLACETYANISVEWIHLGHKAFINFII
jgi:hypothetical protein